MSITFTRINHFHICVEPENLEEAKIFYSEILGLQLIERPDHIFETPGYWFNIGDAQLHIGVETRRHTTDRHTAMEVSDIKSARNHLEANDIEIHAQAKVAGWERFAFVDPFGNRMELLQVTGKESTSTEM
ncbi:VOC family protein [Daejeonella lutea]|uniref:Catechol 2,3-dioxygenase n=1 Tax=Daejeonella lutea TaxID=572036 RepID=A0A1T5BEF5_9SPHI|nr:VOC family protein [Daejeonella lutea]SKB45419.1 Catechol 2,3-dioxygenase [Daejeonella lutea]